MQHREHQVLYIASIFDWEQNIGTSLLCTGPLYNGPQCTSSTLSPYDDQNTETLEAYWRTLLAGSTQIDGAKINAGYYDGFRTWSESFHVISVEYDVVGRYRASSTILAQA
jgi:hypothetical protein